MPGAETGNARADILAAIRKANGNAARVAGADGTEQAAAEAEWSRIGRKYGAAAPSVLHEDLLNRLTDRLHEYDAQVLRCAAPDATASIAAMLKARGVRRLAVPSGLSIAALPDGFDFVVDANSSPLTNAELDGTDGVLTESTLAIAETGSIVLQTVPGQGRRALSLIPDYHLCLVRAADVVASVPEAFARLARTGTLPTTFVSGPSATADIEMTRIKGVHGPRSLDVLLVLA